MASKAVASTVLILSLKLLFFTLVTSTNADRPPPAKKGHHSKHASSALPKPKPSKSATCPIDTLKLGVYADLLNGSVHLVVGPPKFPCCSLIEGLVDLDAAVCLCTAIKAHVLGIHLNVPVSLSLLLNYCGKQVPTGYECA